VRTQCSSGGVMQKCDLIAKLDAYHDGELDEAERLEMEAHLRECPACAAELAVMNSVSRLFQNQARAGLSQIGMYRLHREIDGAMEEGVLRIMRVLSGIAACVLIAGSVWLVKSRSVTVENAAPSAPPWADVARADIETPTAVYSTPAAVWYLADDNNRADGGGGSGAGAAEVREGTVR
jgi:anti-sigma factor RsiW